MSPEDARFLLTLLAGWWVGWSFRGMWESSWELWRIAHKPLPAPPRESLHELAIAQRLAAQRWLRRG